MLGRTLSLTLWTVCQLSFWLMPGTASAEGLDGHWNGNYACSQKITSFALELSELSARPYFYKGTLRFFPHKSNPGGSSGAYRVTVILDPTSLEFTIKPDAWIDNPDQQSDPPSFIGSLSTQGLQVNGEVDRGDCGQFQAKLDIPVGTEPPRQATTRALVATPREEEDRTAATAWTPPLKPCDAFFSWQKPYLDEFGIGNAYTVPGTHHTAQLRAMQDRGQLVSIIPLFEESQLKEIQRTVQGKVQAAIRSFDRDLKECMQLRLGTESAAAGEQGALREALILHLEELARIKRVRPKSISQLLDEYANRLQAFDQLDRDIHMAIETGRAARELADRADQQLKEAAAFLRPSRIAGTLARLEELNERVSAQEQQIAETERLACIEFVHPEDPGLPPDVIGTLDLQPGATTNDAILKCERTIAHSAAQAAGDDNAERDPLALFALGRLHLAAGDQAAAELRLTEAAEAGSAGAYAYLADFSDNPRVALSLAEISADLGFAPAVVYRDELAGYVQELDQAEARAAESRIVAEAKAETDRVAAVDQCDRQAGHPDDPSLPSGIVGVPDDQLDLETALGLCEAAAMLDPANGRVRFAIARLLLMTDGFEQQATDQLQIASDLGHALSSYVAFQREENSDRALEHLHRAASQGLRQAKDIVEAIPTRPKPDALTMEMVYRDVDSLIQRSLLLTYATGIEVYDPQPCKNQVSGMQFDSLVDFTADFYGSRNPNILFPREHIINEYRNYPVSELRETAYHYCVLIGEDFGTCIDLFLSAYSKDVMDRLEEPLFVAVFVANSQAALEDDAFFDKAIGELTDFAGYFYARRLDLVSPFDPIAFDDHFMFTEETDPYVLEVSRSLIAFDKYFAITQAFDSAVLCKLDG